MRKKANKKSKKKERENEMQCLKRHGDTQNVSNLKAKQYLLEKFFIPDCKYLGTMNRQNIVCNQRNCLF